MTKLAETAARSAKEASTTHWTGQHATDSAADVDFWGVETTPEPAETDERAAEIEVFRAEIRALPHLMSVNGGKVHYGDQYDAQNIPACRQSHGHHRISYYRTVELPVTCTVCIGRYGTES